MPLLSDDEGQPPHRAQFHVNVSYQQELVAWECNCSICNMKKNVHAIFPASQLHVDKLETPLTKYQFGTMTAQHLFCPICGVEAYYIPRSNPNG